MLGFPFNMYETAENSDFEFDTLLGFAQAHQKISPSRKSGLGPNLGALQFLEPLR